MARATKNRLVLVMTQCTTVFLEDNTPIGQVMHEVVKEKGLFKSFFSYLGLDNWFRKSGELPQEETFKKTVIKAVEEKMKNPGSESVPEFFQNFLVDSVPKSEEKKTMSQSQHVKTIDTVTVEPPKRPPPEKPHALKRKRQSGYLKLWHPDDKIKPFGYLGIWGVKHGPKFFPEDMSGKAREAFERLIEERKDRRDPQGRIWLDNPEVVVTFVIDDLEIARDIKLSTVKPSASKKPHPTPITQSAAIPLVAASGKPREIQPDISEPLRRRILELETLLNRSTRTETEIVALKSAIAEITSAIAEIQSNLKSVPAGLMEKIDQIIAGFSKPADLTGFEKLVERIIAVVENFRPKKEVDLTPPTMMTPPVTGSNDKNYLTIIIWCLDFILASWLLGIMLSH